jgi:hypothetical protein
VALFQVAERAILEHIYSKLADRGAVLVTLDQFVEIVTETGTSLTFGGNTYHIDFDKERELLEQELLAEQIIKIEVPQDVQEAFQSAIKAVESIGAPEPEIEDAPFDVPEPVVETPAVEAPKVEEEEVTPYELGDAVKFSTGNNFVDCVVEAWQPATKTYTLKLANGPTIFDNVHHHRVYPQSIDNAVKAKRVTFKSPEFDLLVSFVSQMHEAPGKPTHVGMFGSEKLEDGSTLFASYGLYGNGAPYIYVGVSNDQGQALAEAAPNDSFDKPFVVDYKTDRYEVFLGKP